LDQQFARLEENAVVLNMSIKERFAEVHMKISDLKDVRLKPAVIVTEPPPQTTMALATVSGWISNAATGLKEPSVQLTFRSGKNTRSGVAVKIVSVLNDGSYNVSLPAGDYTVEVYKAGFVTSHFTLAAVGGENKPNQQAVISRILADLETRVVLTWGPAPADLDAHLTGPRAGSDRFHVYFACKGNATASPFAILDVDKVSSYGPETVTIKKPVNGMYRYSVMDYTNRELSFTQALAISGAKVEVIRGSSVIHTFTVPYQFGTMWTVFEMDADKITPINTVAYQADTSRVL